MIGSFPVVVVGEVLLDHTGAECDCSQHRGMARGMVRQTQDYGREQGAIGFEHLQMDVPEIFQTRSVIRVALHEDQLGVDSEDFFDRTLHIADI